MTTHTLETATLALKDAYFLTRDEPWEDLGKRTQAMLIEQASAVLNSLVVPTQDTLDRLRVSFGGRIAEEDARRLYRHVMAALLGGDDVIERMAGGEG